MSLDSIWQPNTGPLWLQALLLPTPLWVKPFLKQMNFPLALANLQLLVTIHALAVEKRAALLTANKELGYFPELDVAITREFVTEALTQLEAEVGSEATQAFKDWAYRNLVRREFTNAFLAWRVILRHACGEGNPVYRLLPPPPCLSFLLPQIASLVSYERDEELEDQLLLLSPPYEDKDYLGLDISPEAMDVQQTVRNEWTRAALRLLSDGLSEFEQVEVLTWAESQATEQQLSPQMLLGNMLLRPAGTVVA